jgi:DNA-binding response OmpR family regulator
VSDDQNNNTILVVDDSDIICQSLKKFFSNYHINVITSHDGLDGIQKIAEHNPVLIFLDLMMPNFDGVKMLQVIKVLEKHKTIPVIVISGNTNRTNVLAAIEAGADRVISKPLKKEIIIKNINELLGEDFLPKLKSENLLPSLQQEDVQKQLLIMFLKSFPAKKEALRKGLQTHDKESIKNVAHEIRGTGSTIGYPHLSVLGVVIEDHISGMHVNWSQIQLMCDQIFTLVDEIEVSNSLIEK